MASFSKRRFSQWVKAVPSSPWSSSSAPESLLHPKCFLTSSRTLGVTTTSTSFVLSPVRMSGLLRTALYLFSFLIVASLHCRVCSSSLSRGFPLSPRGVSGSPSCDHWLVVDLVIFGSKHQLLAIFNCLEWNTHSDDGSPCPDRMRRARLRIRERGASRVSPSREGSQAPAVWSTQSLGRDWRGQRSAWVRRLIKGGWRLSWIWRWAVD